MKYKRLCQNHPRIDLKRIRRLKAMFKGGSALLENTDVMNEVFPKYTHETDAVYKERLSRAFYENIFAMVINQVAAGLAQDPVNFSPKEDLKPKVEEPKVEEPDDDDSELKKWVDDEAPAKQLDQYWIDLLDNATPLSDDGSSTRTFDQVIRDMVVEALVIGWSWIQAELPEPVIRSYDSDGREIVTEPTTLGEQEEAGLLRAYTVLWPSEQVTDWSEQNGRLLWLRTYQCDTPAMTPEESRSVKIHTWTIWYPDRWEKFVYRQEENKQMPGLEDDVPLTATGNHSFGRVPWTMLDVSSPKNPGAHLHIGDLIESLCRNYFNRTNGESFQWTQFYYQQLYEFLGPEVGGIDNVVSEAQEDPQRAHRRRAPGVVHVRGMEDRAEYVAPNMGGASEGRAATQEIRDAILRVVAQMALAQDTSGAMLRRSADSKRQDSVAQEIVLGAIGKMALTTARSVTKLLGSGRGDTEVPDVRGYERFNVTDAEQLINQAVNVTALNIPSAAYQIEYMYQVAVTHLGDNASAELKATIRAQLEAAITQDQILTMAQPPDPFIDDEDDEDEEEAAEEDPFAKDKEDDAPRK